MAADTESRERPEGSGGSGGSERPRRPGRAVIAVALVAVAALVACGILGYLLVGERRQNVLREDADYAASAYVEALATYDHENLDENLERVTAVATPEFAARYRDLSSGLVDLLTGGQGTSTGTVTHAAVETLTDDTATVLVFLDQEVTNVTIPEGRLDVSRMIVTLARSGDRWLLDGADLA